MVELKKIATEQRNPNTMNIDTLSTLEMVKLINEEDHKVAEAVSLVAGQIALAVVGVGDRHGVGQRLIQSVAGNGTDDRLLGCFPHDLGRCLTDILKVDREGCRNSADRSVGGKCGCLEIALAVCGNRYRGAV